MSNSLKISALNMDVFAEELQRKNPSKKHTSKNIKNFIIGDFFIYLDEEYIVADIYKYKEVEWYKFSPINEFYEVTELNIMSLESGEIISIEYDSDSDDFYVNRPLKLEQLTHNSLTIDSKMLNEISEEEEGDILYDNGAGRHEFGYSEDDTWAAVDTSRTSYEKPTVRFYSFYSEDTEDEIVIDIWETKPRYKVHPAYISSTLNPSLIKSLS